MSSAPRDTSEQLGGFHTTVAGNDPTICVDQNGADKSELLNTGSDLLDLFWGVRARISGTRFQQRGVAIGNFETGHVALTESRIILLRYPVFPCYFRTYGADGGSAPRRNPHIKTEVRVE